MNIKKIAGLSLLAIAGALAAAPSFAGATRVNPVALTEQRPSHTFAVRPRSWSDPAFGFQGWSHHAQWGSVRARRGQQVTLRFTAATPGIFPAVTVWHRGHADTAPDFYFNDHFFHQFGDVVEKGATDEGTGAPIGDIVMRYVAHGYDRDNNTLNLLLFNPITDGTPGVLEVSFTARRAGNYVFAVGALNPGPEITNFGIRYNVTGRATVVTPQ